TARTSITSPRRSSRRSGARSPKPRASIPASRASHPPRERSDRHAPEGQQFDGAVSERRLRRRTRFLGGGFGRGAKPPSEFSWGEASEGGQSPPPRFSWGEVSEGGKAPLRFMIAVVDYGRGNLGSVEKAFSRLGMAAVVTEDPSVVAD